MGSGMKVLTTNRRASHDYSLEEFFEAGLVLMGSEIKSIRSGHSGIAEAFVQERNGELWILNMYIKPYDEASRKGHESYRPRKLLLHKKEIAKITMSVARKGYTIIPTKLYLKDGRAKIEIALAKGKNVGDKREDIRRRDDQRNVQRELKEYR